MIVTDVDGQQWLRAVQRRSTLSAKARAVAAVLFAHMDPDDGSHCSPSLDTIAREAGYRKRDAILGRRATARHAARLGPLDELERAGWLIRLRRPGQGRGHATTAYYATVPPLAVDAYLEALDAGVGRSAP